MRPDSKPYFAITKTKQKTLLVGKRRAIQKTGPEKVKKKKLYRNNNQAPLQVCTENHDRVIRISEVMAVDWPPTSY